LPPALNGDFVEECPTIRPRPEVNAPPRADVPLIVRVLTVPRLPGVPVRAPQVNVRQDGRVIDEPSAESDCRVRLWLPAKDNESPIVVTSLHGKWRYSRLVAGYFAREH